MNISKHLSSTVSLLSKIWWVMLIPFMLDLSTLLSYHLILKTEYVFQSSEVFTLKVGFVGSLPSISYFIKDMGDIFYNHSNHYGYQGLLARNMDILLFMQILSATLVISLLKSFYLNSLNQINSDTSFNFKKVLAKTNKHWHKYLILHGIGTYVLIQSFNFLILYFLISLIFIYVDYSIVVDDLPLYKALGKSASIFFSNFFGTIILAFVVGLSLSPFSFIFYSLARQGSIALVGALALMAFLGTIASKVIMEVYRDFSEPKGESLEDIKRLPFN